MHSIESFQTNILKKSIKFIDQSLKKNIDIGTSPLCFLTPWATSPGKFKLDLIMKKKIEFKSIFKNFLNISKNHDLNVFFNNIISHRFIFSKRNFFRMLRCVFSGSTLSALGLSSYAIRIIWI